MNKIMETLHHSRLFIGVTDKEIEEIVKSGSIISAKPGEIIIAEGEKDETLLINLDGVIKVFKTSIDGRELILYYCKAGEAVNDVWIMGNNASIASVQAISPLNYFAIKRSRLEGILLKHPGTGLRVLRELSSRICNIVGVLGDAVLKRVLNRLAKLLLDITEGEANYGRTLSQQEMAGILGTVREVVARSIRELKESGIISVKQNRIVIMDMYALRTVVAGVVLRKTN